MSIERLKRGKPRRLGAVIQSYAVVVAVFVAFLVLMALIVAAERLLLG
ncbi:MAG: hypothetical protein LBD25_07730 [Coriobacteriales bacterium]|nr:hypothetical protein [Coriobacteriales bacterium]